MRALLISTALSGLVSLASAGEAASAPEAAPAAQAAAASSSVAVGAAAAPKLVCHRELPTGSTISRNVCRPEGADDATRAQTQLDLANQAQRNRPITLHPGS